MLMLMLLKVDVSEVDVLVVDVLELDVLGARHCVHVCSHETGQFS